MELLRNTLYINVRHSVVVEWLLHSAKDGQTLALGRTTLPVHGTVRQHLHEILSFSSCVFHRARGKGGLPKSAPPCVQCAKVAAKGGTGIFAARFLMDRVPSHRRTAEVINLAFDRPSLSRQACTAPAPHLHRTTPHGITRSARMARIRTPL